MSEDCLKKRIVRCIIPAEEKGMRLDLYLAHRFSYRSRSAWQKAVTDGQILLNGTTTKASRILTAGDEISLNTDNMEEPPVDRNYELLLERDEFIIVNKNGQIPVHPSGCYFNHTLLNILQEKWDVLYPVNRLDRETSGATVFAKTKEAAAKLSGMFQARQVEKRYLTIVHGVFPEKLDAAGFLSADKNCVIHKKRKFTIECAADEKESESCLTAFKRIFANHSFSVVECIPHTGRLHQIRATLCSLGFPLVGDKLYGLNPEFYLRWIENRLTDDDSKKLLLTRQALHASSIQFNSPFSGEKILCRATLPVELKRLQDEISGV